MTKKSHSKEPDQTDYFINLNLVYSYLQNHPAMVAKWSKTPMQIQVVISPLQTQVQSPLTTCVQMDNYMLTLGSRALFPVLLFIYIVFMNKALQQPFQYHCSMLFSLHLSKTLVYEKDTKVQLVKIKIVEMSLLKGFPCHILRHISCSAISVMSFTTSN